MTLDDFTAYCMAKPGVTGDRPMSGDALWLKVAGKMFAMTNVEPLKMDGEMVDPFHFINLKCDPDRALMLRAEYDAIIPGWRQNKTHWNSLLMGHGLSDALIKDLTDHSYRLVAASLTKKKQEELGL
ncbi:MAG: MmcQ/YjbR family DNA-binding protein [Proteobacteria bacterium]|nr:MmcQ/YjbR family DNA-binding protein [Pseudomonadota bacterium]